MNWKETAWLWFTRAGQFWLAQTLIIYLWACFVASKPIGPVAYVKSHYYYVTLWNPRNAPALPKVEASIYGKRN
jgi:hypothetical protein